MTFMAQIGVVILVIIMLIIIGLSNKALTGASEEGEKFVDEWAMREERKARLEEEKQLRLEEKRKREAEKKRQRELESERNNVYNREPIRPKNMGYEGQNGVNPTRQKNIAYGPQNGMEPVRTKNMEQGAAPTIQWNSEKIVPFRFGENPHAFSLCMFGAYGEAKRICVNTFPFFIGRESSNQLVLDHLCIANRHAVIVEEEGKILLKDLGTKNKIFSDGRFVEVLELRDQMRFTIGDVDFMVEMAVPESYKTRSYGRM